MRPLTFRKLLFQCFFLLVILFFVVVVALKFGAVPVSLYALGRDLLRVILGQSSQISSDYGLIIQNIRLPRIILGIIRSEEHTSELQSQSNLVCRLLLE